MAERKMTRKTKNTLTHEMLLQNDIIRIYIINALHLWCMDLLTKVECRDYIDSIQQKINLLLDLSQPLETQLKKLSPRFARKACQEVIERSNQAMVLDDFLDQDLILGNVQPLDSFEAENSSWVHKLKVNSAVDASSNVANFRPFGINTPKDEEEEINKLIKILANPPRDQNQLIPYVPVKNKRMWLAPATSQTHRAEETRNKLGLDHLPLKDHPKARRLIRLQLPMANVEQHATLHRPTIFDSPGLRFRALTCEERTASQKLSYGMTVDLDNFTDGYAEVVAKFQGSASFPCWKVVDLGDLAGLHTNALDHIAFANHLEKITVSPASCFEREMRGFSIIKHLADINKV